MRLSPIDIKKQEFRKSFKGYDVGEVEAYLDTVGNEVESLYREIESLRELLQKAENEKEAMSKEVQVYRENEKTFQKAIVKSQDMAEEVLENAKKRAELIIKEAEILSTKTKVQVQEEFVNLRQELEELRMKNEAIIDDIKNYLAEKLNSIEEYQRNRKIFKLETAVGTEKEEDSSHNTFGMNMNIDMPDSGG
ncbi:MAG: DivIVA domain-containing protein [Chlorobi bacterium]|nr:DivIVA domain-containing protein [Chlorobiota bacterium]MCI0716872.1 DivIVA domain-containing protein [Chlorobiota bacterium]